MNLVKTATAIGIQEGLANSAVFSQNVKKRLRSPSPVPSNSGDSDLPIYGSGVAQEETVPAGELFGVNINKNIDDPDSSSDSSPDEEDENLYVPDRIPPHAIPTAKIGTSDMQKTLEYKPIQYKRIS